MPASKRQKTSNSEEQSEAAQLKDDEPEAGDSQDKQEPAVSESEGEGKISETKLETTKPEEPSTAKAKVDSAVLPENIITFPMKLRSLLDDEQFKDVIWWLPGGEAFCIAPADFSERILEKHFQGTKFESFTRKLNRWGFRKAIGHVIPPDAISFQHGLFKKEKPELVKLISGKKKNSAAAQQATAANAISSPIQQSLQGRNQAVFPGSVALGNSLNQGLLGQLSDAAVAEALAHQQSTADAIRRAQLLADAQRLQLLQDMQAPQHTLGQGVVHGTPLDWQGLSAHPRASRLPSLPGGNSGLNPSAIQATLEAANARQRVDQRLMELYLLQEEQRKLENQGGQKR